MVFFYDGALEAVDGLLTLPVDRPEWIRRAWVSGYRLTEDGRMLGGWGDIEAELSNISTKSASSAKSTEDKSGEDSGTGRQSETRNRVRATEQESSTGVSKGRASSPSRRSADGEQEKTKGE
jgi:hypothetical protein